MKSPVQRPERTHRAADWLLIPLALTAALSLVTFLWTPGTVEDQLARVPVFFGGWLGGFVLPRLHHHRYRALGMAPYAALAAALFLVLTGGPFDTLSLWQVFVFCLLEGLAIGGVLRYRDYFRQESGHLLVCSVLGVLAGIVLLWSYRQMVSKDGAGRELYLWAFLGLTIFSALWAWGTLLRAAIEFPIEFVAAVMYRMTRGGVPGDVVPRSGPVLVIANHAAWFDPLFLAKWIQRPLTPMMTAKFYDKPILRTLMIRVLHVIRVQEVAMRREAPEVQEAIAALDAGKCVVIFPEGYLRRKEDQPLRRFGQGVWQILKERPTTPVVACWLEGSWGSYFSFKDGPPTKNKKKDLRHPLTVTYGPTATVPAEVLAEHLMTRIYLMNRVLETRAMLGLPPIPPFELPTRSEDEETDPSE